MGLKLLAMAPLFETPIVVRRIPRNNQVRYFLELLEQFGGTVTRDSDDDDGFGVTVHLRDISKTKFVYQEIRWCRHTFLMAMAVLLRTGSVVVPIPGYSHYGARPIDGQLNGLRRMGAIVHPVRDGYIRIEIPSSGLTGSEIFLPFPSNAVTEALLMAAVTAEGTTTIHGCAQEPETIELCLALRQSGAAISGIGTSSLTIKSSGLRSLCKQGEITVAPDRIEAATFAAAVALRGGEVTIEKVRGSDLAAVRAVLTALGGHITPKGEDSWNISSEHRPKASNITTGPFPAFPTDAQGPFLAVLARALGVSVVNERLWSNRLSLAMELRRMGANIELPSGDVAIIHGVESLSGAPVIGTDPRATAALILAGLFADGETIVAGLDLLDNAYDSFDLKLRALGAQVDRGVVPTELFGTYHPHYGRLEAF